MDPTPRPAPTIAVRPTAPRQRDMGKIDRNLKRLVQQKAPDEDIKAYLEHEGVTLDEVLQQDKPKSSTPFFDSVGRGISNAAGTVAGAAGKVADYVFPPEDPKYAGTPALLDPSVTTVGAKMTALSDEAYHDVLKANLGDRYIATERDANGAAVIRYRDKDGREKLGYVNQPGPDWQDVDRVISGSIPYVAGGMLAKGAQTAAGLGRWAGALMQGGSAAGVSVGQDVVAQQQGSEQPIDVPRAALTGVLGGASELVPLPIVAGAMGAGVGVASGETAEERLAGGVIGGSGGYLAGKGINRVFQGPKPVVDPMSPQIRARAKAAGLNPDEMSEAQFRQFGASAGNVTDEAELASTITTNRFGIPTTKGQRTKDPELLTIEKDARYGNLGQDAKQLLDAFDREQKRAIDEAALGSFGKGAVDDEAQLGIGRIIAGERRSTNTLGRDVMGQSIQGGLARAKASADSQISKAWEGLDDIFPHQEAFKALPQAIDGKLGDMAVDPQTMPAAGSMLTTLRKFMAGEEAPMGSGLGEPATRRMDMDFVRRRLLADYKSAKAANAPDVKQAKAIYDGFNDWIDDVAERGLVAGDPANAAKLRTAREITKEIKDLWSPRGKSGKSPAARIIERVTDESMGADRIVAELLGDAGTQATPKAGTTEALTRIKASLFRFGGKDGQRVWNDIRLAQWSKIALDKKGNVASPQVMLNNLEQAFARQRSVMRTLYSDNELMMMGAFRRALKEVAYKDPNPSGTATALRSAMREPGFAAGTAKTLLQTQAKRELFSKHNVMMSRIYQILAKNIPNTFGAKDAVGTAAARRAVDPRLSLRPRPMTGPIGASMGAPTIENMRDGNKITYGE